MELNGFKVAVVGATGAVGNLMVKVLEERAFPVSVAQTSGVGAFHRKNARFSRQ